ncbi:MAG: FecR family protein, partial [Bdellovibrionota bacterium]
MNRLFYFLLTLLLCATASRVAADDSKSVTVYALSGEASYLAAGAALSQKESLSKGQQLPLAGTVTVGNNSRLGLRFSDGRLVRLRENSQLVLSPATESEEESVNLLSGAVHIFNRVSKAKYNVKTPEVSAAIRGTELSLSTSGGNSTLTVFDGEALIHSAQEALRVSQGETATASKNGKPTKMVLAQPIDQVQWALYFPVIFS